AVFPQRPADRTGYEPAAGRSPEGPAPPLVGSVVTAPSPGPEPGGHTPSTVNMKAVRFDSPCPPPTPPTPPADGLRPGTRPAPPPAGGAGARQPLSPRSNFSWSLVSNIVYAGCQWGMLLVTPRLGSPEMLGQFALALAVTPPALAFGNLKARGVQASDARREY